MLPLMTQQENGGGGVGRGGGGHGEGPRKVKPSQFERRMMCFLEAHTCAAVLSEEMGSLCMDKFLRARASTRSGGGVRGGGVGGGITLLELAGDCSGLPGLQELAVTVSVCVRVVLEALGPRCSKICTCKTAG